MISELRPILLGHFWTTFALLVLPVFPRGNHATGGRDESGNLGLIEEHDAGVDLVAGDLAGMVAVTKPYIAKNSGRLTEVKINFGSEKVRELVLDARPSSPTGNSR